MWPRPAAPSRLVLVGLASPPHTSGSGWQLQSAPGALKSGKKQEDAGQKMDVMKPLITPAHPSLAKQTGGDRA